ncbi:MAG TPA: hypothetical protein VK852_07650 [Desulfobacterales bacterium]|nr:hypothetical protein [Desulfobacterales bacterium]
MQRLTIEDLQHRRQRALIGAVEAIRKRRPAYLELKKLVHAINSRPLDVADYYLTASRLATLLGSMRIDGGETIFDYFAEHIDPRKYGEAVNFRVECRDLDEQLKSLEAWRARQNRLRRVK